MAASVVAAPIRPVENVSRPSSTARDDSSRISGGDSGVICAITRRMAEAPTSTTPSTVGLNCSAVGWEVGVAPVFERAIQEPIVARVGSFPEPGPPLRSRRPRNKTPAAAILGSKPKEVADLNRRAQPERRASWCGELAANLVRVGLLPTVGFEFRRCVMGVSICAAGGGDVAIDDAAIHQLRSSVSGTLLTASSPGYDAARTVWNGMIDRSPALVVQCASTHDVVAAVRFAAAHALKIAVRGGGHNIAGNAVCDRGLMIDLSPMKAVRVDATRRTAWVEPGVTLGEFDAEAQKSGLATPLGINSTTGVAGLTLGGGFGWLSRSLGLTIDNLLEAEVVLASGERVRATEKEHADLFWAIRGGGGNFGIVTGFQFRLHAIGTEVLSGLVVHPLGAARDVLRFYRGFVASAPEEFVCWFVMRQAPPLPFLAPEWHGKEILALAMCYHGDLAEGERIAKPLRAFGNPIADVVAPHPFVGWQQVLDPLLAAGARNYWKSHDFRELSDGLIDVLHRRSQFDPGPAERDRFRTARWGRRAACPPTRPPTRIATRST